VFVEVAYYVQLGTRIAPAGRRWPGFFLLAVLATYAAATVAAYAQSAVPLNTAPTPQGVREVAVIGVNSVLMALTRLRPVVMALLVICYVGFFINLLMLVHRAYATAHAARLTLLRASKVEAPS
jgi:hypothetical protein